MKKLRFNYKPYIIENKNYSTLQFNIIFCFKNNPKDSFNYDILRQLLLNTNSKYISEIEYRKAYEENMIISQTLNISKYNDNAFFNFELIVPDYKKIKDYDLKKALQFFYDTIYSPNIKNNQFDNNLFLREQIYLKNRYLNRMKNIYQKTYEDFLEIFDETNSIISNSYDIKLIEKANPKYLYRLYKKIISSNKVMIMYGDIDSKTKDMFNSIFKSSDEKFILDINYDKFLKPYNNIKDITKTSDYHESILYAGFKVQNMRIKDKLYLVTLKNILGNGNNLILKKLRQDNNLVYSTYTSCDKFYGTLEIETYINSSSKDITLDKINEVINELKNEDYLTGCMQKVIKDMEADLIRTKDKRRKKLDDFIYEKAHIGFSLEKLIDLSKNINILDFIKFIDRLKLDTIYFLKGEDNE